MDKALAYQLAEAEDHVVQGTTHLLWQRQIVGELERHGQDASPAKDFLRSLNHVRFGTQSGFFGFKPFEKAVAPSNCAFAENDHFFGIDHAFLICCRQLVKSLRHEQVRHSNASGALPEVKGLAGF